MIDWTFNIPSLIGGIGAIVTVVFFIARLQGRVEATERASATLNLRVAAVEANASMQRDQFHEYQLLVARDYVTHGALLEIKRDLITEIARMESRVENQINRLAQALKVD